MGKGGVKRGASWARQGPPAPEPSSGRCPLGLPPRRGSTPRSVVPPPLPCRVFTGLIEELGRVASVRPVEGGIVLEIDPAGWSHRPTLGESIAVNGCCLTVARSPGAHPATAGAGTTGHLLRFDVIRQTLEATTLAGLGPGQRVNLEASATPTTRLGGHIVQGHIDGIGTVLAVTRDPTQWRLRISTPEDLGPLVVHRGSIAVDGVSLTVAAVEPCDRPSWFEVALIPTTLEKTTLGERGVGDRVNLESDVMMRGVVHALRWRDAGGAARP